MASKYNLENNIIYIKDSDIPENKLNLNNSTIIHELEKELLKDAYEIFFNEMDEKTIFDEYYFKELHRRTFQDLYEWAGKYRDFNMSKGESRFCQGAFVQKSSEDIFKKLKEDNYLKDFEDKPKDEFAKKISYYKCEIIALHPFYELNGRIVRLFFDMIANYNGYKYIDYSTCSPNEYLDASIECVQYANNQKLEKIIYNGLIHKI